MKAARINTIFSRFFGFSSPLLVLAFFLLFGTGCKGQKQAAQQAPAPNATNTMFQKMNQGSALPRPPTEEEESAPEQPPAGLVPGMMLEESPECKNYAAEQTSLRDQIDQLAREQVGPAEAKAEAAREAFDECQDDVGCVNNLEKYEVRNKAYQSAKKALEDVEKSVEALETQLYQVSQKIAAKCDSDPL